jgi:thymidine phosphorylase
MSAAKIACQSRAESDDQRILATLNVVDHDGWLPTRSGVSEQAFALLGLPEGSAVTIEQAVPPKSLEAVLAKIRGSIIRDIALLRYSRMEITPSSPLAPVSCRRRRCCI